MPERPPNILWYCTDQQRFDTIGALGNPHVHTPNLDRFVAEGVAFTHAYCQSPICTPSRASFLTGMYPSAIHANGNSVAHFADARPLVTKRLVEAGYDGGLVGKLHLAQPRSGIEPRVGDGYRFFRYSHSPRDNWPAGEHHYADWLREQGHDARALLGDTRDPDYLSLVKKFSFGGLYTPSADQDNVPPALHQTTWCTEMSIEFIQAARPADQPWILCVNPFDPHPPYDPPWEYFRRFDPASLPGPHFQPSDLVHQRRLADAGVDFQTAARPPEEFEARTMQAAYYAMIEQLDEQFGRLLDGLEATGEAEHTVVIFTSDHGESLGDHGLTLKGCRFFDGLTRVPLMWRWPGRFRSNLQASALVELTDIAPTLLELAGLSPPTWMEGRSLLPILAGQAAADRHRDFVRCEYYDALPLGSGSFATMYRDARWKLNVYHDTGAGELYDLEADPYEFQSLWDDPAHGAIKADLLQKSFDATARAIDWGPPRVTPYAQAAGHPTA